MDGATATSSTTVRIDAGDVWAEWNDGSAGAALNDGSPGPADASTALQALDRDAGLSAEPHEGSSADDGTASDGGGPSNRDAAAASRDDGGNEDAADAHDDKAAPPETITVTGIIVDSWRHPVPTAVVSIGDRPTVVTKDDGVFQIDHVQPPYDVAFYVPSGAEWWVFQGLTGKSTHPILQMGEPFVGKSAGVAWSRNISFSVVPVGSISDSVTGHVVFASPGGTYSSYELEASTEYGGMRWFGLGLSDPGTIHLLAARPNANADNVLAYTGYQSLPNMVLDFNAPSAPAVAFDLTSGGELPTSTVTVNFDGSDTVTNIVADVQFDRLAASTVINDTAFRAPKAYKLPKRDKWTYAVSAVQGHYNTRPVRIATKQGLSGDAVEVTLSLPAEATPTSPGPTDIVDMTTAFTWTNPADASSDCVKTVTINLGANGGIVDRRLRIVTTQRTVRIPSFSSDIPPVLPKNAGSYWYVQTHNSFKSVDDLVAGAGYVGTYDYNSRIGPEDRDSMRTFSKNLDFTTAP